ncbi:MAG TPA: polynucleotide adenylyltransferase PcnB [Oleiagrimonas sp.]|nr:polynucleotide adenylyltransferase PcnB [Oleiagrimonas sp.]
MNRKPGIVDTLPEPRVIARDGHTISRKHISKGALRVLYRLHESGYRACLVGGAVRDLLLGVTPKDFDVATDATPEQVRQLFRNCRLIGRRFRLAHVLFGREIVEVATFRGFGEGGEGDDTRRVVDGRLVRDNVWGSIEEDALRRDFRVNALYYDIADFSVIDYVGGMRDLDDRVLRLIGDPEQRYREDPVRMLRAARLSAKLGFAIDEAALAPIVQLRDLLADASPARLFDESLKLFMAGRAADSFHTLERLGLLETLFPATAGALQRDDAALRGMIEQGLANTDERVADGRRVTPAFLFAVLLWDEARRQVAALVDNGLEPSLAWQRASHHVVAAQSRHVAIPRRFSRVMEEIWILQPRFARRTRKRAFRLLEHPRFRAAYDFLLLRAPESEELRELGEWWTRAQELPADALARELGGGAAKSDHAQDGETAPAAKRRRRRGRRRRKKPSAGE